MELVDMRSRRTNYQLAVSDAATADDQNERARRMSVVTPAVPAQLQLQQRRAPYLFDAQGAVHRHAEAAARELPTLKGNIGMRPDDDRFDISLTSFIVTHHLNIEWYDARIRKERKLRATFIAGSLVLLIAIPVATFAASESMSAGSPSVVGVQLTALLAGVIGVQNALRGILEKRNLLSIFHKASAQLKRAVYDFERRWAGCVPGDDAGAGDLERFRLDVDNATHKAREVEREEEAQYFDAIAGTPLPDLRSAITEAAQAASGIVSRFGVSESPRARASHVVDTRVLREKVNVLRAKLATLESNLAATASGEQQLLIERSIGETRVRLSEAEATLLAAIVRELDRSS
jgi:hypothetical protein